MEPIAYVTRLNEHYRSQGFPPYKWSVYENAPLTALSKPLAQCRVALLTSGGVSYRDAQPFNPQARNDLRVDAIASGTRPAMLVINDDYYSHRDADRDVNCIFPIDPLRELVAEGVVGAVADNHYSGFMGRIYTRDAVINRAAPALAHRLRAELVDAAVLVPA
ncbi:MAG TPA: glycine/sarcosine/betaine reductase selenoprotein B family protein [Candidatus Binataceae bacterium]|nr:glycine/sarcosine/betaine reductase selenoprotein B family protein [Candidatus Binataceae bacterium]